jgi:AAA+ superfamily predicted ATPase
VLAADGNTEIAPCLLVLEDLDGLFDAEGLAFFLNELDGFAENSGLVTLGTTNHPERLDPALLDRPSRFDRTYAFELPNDEERRRYLTRQNEHLATAGKLGEATIDELVGATREFSFAYLKELVVGALLAVVSGPATSTEEAARAAIPRLREQLGRAREIASKPVGRSSVVAAGR